MISTMILITIAVKFKASLIDKLAWAGLALRHGAKVYGTCNIVAFSVRENCQQRCMVIILMIITIAMKFRPASSTNSHGRTSRCATARK